ncbi:MAG: VCBS repeat-containing protein [Saprospiraceae bacterium]|nr:VCBS repeat-containing protein [Saprospiraceae bacterium]
MVLIRQLRHRTTFDGDGDLDLFVGSRSIPQNYGTSPRSFIYRNDGKGLFSDATPTLAPELAKLGMITDAEWADTDGDGKKELIVVGEWLEPTIFEYDKGQFLKKKITGFTDKKGWWSSLTVADLNGDGANDLILGNLGENSYLSNAQFLPLKLWINDFDGNQYVEKILTRTVGGRDVPISMKKDLTDGFPFLKKTALRHAEYAQKSVQDLLPKDKIKKALVWHINYMQSVIAMNDGKGNFTLKPLPLAAQLSSVNVAITTDLNGDKLPDLILGGNNFCFQPQYGRLDANFGEVLINKGNFEFESVPFPRSSLMLKGCMVRDIHPLSIGNENWLFFAINNQKPRVFRIGNGLRKPEM